ncbi:MAG: hypothetical protein BGO12_10780 [Verrucomicrobia bacterium 61-8]|nr:MAG: hypothetical protein BGO12_10780 [Verrucomicrobia bacterium 61-8]
MKFIQDKVKDIVGRLSEPFARIRKYSVVISTHQHDAEHAVVGNENIRRGVLHVPPASHFASVEPWEEVTRLLRALVCSVFLNMLIDDSHRFVRLLQLAD